MKFTETKLTGAYIIDLEPREDDRGFFARSFCKREFEALGLSFNIAQCNISYNKKKGTLRGMHYQVAPYEEVKIVSCIRGAIYDVIIDLRPDSPTYCQWIPVELSGENNKLLYVPKGFAHGFQTLEDDTKVCYQMSEFHCPEYATGIRSDDPVFNIKWPLADKLISLKDQNWPLFNKYQPGNNNKSMITQDLAQHYSRKFTEFGPTPEGVDWKRKEDVWIRYDKMLAVIDPFSKYKKEDISFLDVGCGYGGLYEYAKEKEIVLDYTGIDVAQNMIEYALSKFHDARFYCEDIFSFTPAKPFDYVVCNGILTQKLSTSILDMDLFAHALVKKLFELCKIGIAFNVMTTKVNFTVNNLYYRNPIELFAYCLNEISRKIKIDHSYPLYEYTLYIYK